MGSYLCVFDKNDDELEGVEIGLYADFDVFRTTVADELEHGRIGDRYPTLGLHSDCDGEWSRSECETLKRELADIADAFRKLPPRPFSTAWQQGVAKLLGLRPQTLFDSFIDVDGEPLLDRLQRLCQVAIENNLPIVFQ
jgi:hypothetical protein